MAVKLNIRRSAVLFAALFFLQPGNFARADRVPARILHVDLTHETGKREFHLVYLDDGRIVKLPSEQRAWLEQVEAAHLSDSPLALFVDSRRYVYQVEAATSVEQKDLIPPAAPPAEEAARPLEDYVPTVLADSAAATRIFNDLNPRYRRRSQCYNRAHVWSYESKNEHQLNSMKVFLFFTRKYIWDYDYGWWFHVSPYTLVQTPAGPVEQVLDFTFMRKVVDLQTWTNEFVEPHPVCPVVTRYQDYSEHQQESYCYLIKVPMYYWQPRDIENVSNGQTPKTAFIDAEVNQAYRQGFY